MPHKFVDPRGNSPSLQEVDRELCELWDIPCDEVDWSVPYRIILEIGLRVLIRGGPDTRKELKGFLEQYPDVRNYSGFDSLVPFIDGTKYYLEGWR